MVGYKEMPRARNAHRAEVFPFQGSDQSQMLIVYKQRGSFFARHPQDEYMLARVVRVDSSNKFVCTSLVEAERLGYEKKQ